MKLKVGLLICVLLLAFGPGIGVYAQISPGELARVHSHLEGMSNCTKCHTLGEQVSNEKCLACHTELKARIDQKKGFHASYEVRGKKCAGCHNDHHGVNFKIIRFDTDKFNHEQSGYKLTGAHSRKKCADCHKAEFISDPKIRAKKFTYLGLKTNCLNCHTDYHQKTLSPDCAGCHNDEKFKPASKFDHQKAKFKLAGKHEQVACADCHKTTTRNGQKFQEFKGVKASNCTNCHKDVHENKFGQNCAECHNSVSFTAVAGVKNFDHDKTAFKLEGCHLGVACKSCHKQKLTTPIKHNRCSDCHTDYHSGQFAKNGISPDCSACHAVKGFSGFSFSIEQHNAGVFPLKGAHLATPCFACHKKQEKWNFRQIGSACADCHENIHQPFISAKYYPSASCETCHNPSRWSMVEFDHSKTQFALQGAHARQACRDCHFNKEKTGHANQKFAGLSTTCSTCHADKHMQQFAVNGVTDCSRCHGVEMYKPASKFDHSKTKFVLDGKHVNVACNKCHKEVTEQGVTFVWYKIKSFQCVDCHL